MERQVLATDISPKAVEDAAANIAAHGLEERITAIRSDAFLHPKIRENAPYGLIICNMLAEYGAKAQDISPISRRAELPFWRHPHLEGGGGGNGLSKPRV